MVAVEEEKAEVLTATNAPAAAPAIATPFNYIELRTPPLWPRLPPIRQHRPTLEQRLAAVPQDLQQILIERGRTLERRERAQRDLLEARAQLEQLEYTQQAQAEREMARAHLEQHIEQTRYMTAVPWMGADWSPCCTPTRASLKANEPANR